MDITGIWEGILIGSAGGAAAGLVLAVVQQGSRWVVEKIHSRRVYGWLCANTTDAPGSISRIYGHYRREHASVGSYDRTRPNTRNSALTPYRI